METRVDFNSTSPNWDPHNNLNNDFFVHSAMNYCGHLMKSRGHVFVNDVLDQLGIRRIPEGQLYGWLEKEGLIEYEVLRYENQFVIVLEHQGDIHQSI